MKDNIQKLEHVLKLLGNVQNELMQVKGREGKVIPRAKFEANNAAIMERIIRQLKESEERNKQ